MGALWLQKQVEKFTTQEKDKRRKTTKIRVKPDFLLYISNTSSAVLFNFLHKYGITEGSTSPVRVPIITPANGVNPIDVSIHTPS